MMPKVQTAPVRVAERVELSRLRIVETSQTLGRGLGTERSDLAALASSMARVGQLHPIYALDDGQVIAGRQRAKALISFAAKYGFTHADVVRVTVDDAALVVLVENFVRTSPTTAETCRQVHAMLEGQGCRRYTAQELAEVLDLSVTHVRNLGRFWAQIPPQVRDLWREDRDRQFTFRVLNRLATLSGEGVPVSTIVDMLRPQDAPVALQERTREDKPTRGSDYRPRDGASHSGGKSLVGRQFLTRGDVVNLRLAIAKRGVDSAYTRGVLDALAVVLMEQPASELKAKAKVPENESGAGVDASRSLVPRATERM